MPGATGGGDRSGPDRAGATNGPNRAASSADAGGGAVGLFDTGCRTGDAVGVSGSSDAAGGDESEGRSAVPRPWGVVTSGAADGVEILAPKLDAGCSKGPDLGVNPGGRSRAGRPKDGCRPPYPASGFGVAGAAPGASASASASPDTRFGAGAPVWSFGALSIRPSQAESALRNIRSAALRSPSATGARAGASADGDANDLASRVSNSTPERSTARRSPGPVVMSAMVGVTASNARAASRISAGALGSCRAACTSATSGARPACRGTASAVASLTAWV